MLANGADVNKANYQGDTPLHTAAFWGIEANIKLLLQYGADRSIKNKNGETAYDVAMAMGYTDLAKLLKP